MLSLSPSDPENQTPGVERNMFGAIEFFQRLWNHRSSVAVIALASYIALVNCLRYRRKEKIEGPFSNRKRPLSSMTVKEAHEIMTQLQELEFPHAFAKARRMALLKVRQRIFGRLIRHQY